MSENFKKDILIKIKSNDFEERIEKVVPMLTDEYHLYGIVNLIKDLYHCVCFLSKIIEE